MGPFSLLELVASASSNISDSCAIKWPPLAFSFETILYKIVLPTINITAHDIKPFTAPAIISVPNVDAGTIFWICGAPGATIAKVEHPKVKAAGINLRGKSASLKISKAIGNTAKLTTKTLTPP